MIGLVHLVWAPLGPEPLRAFLRSYHAHPAGAEHELVVVLNGASGEGGSTDGDLRGGGGDDTRSADGHPAQNPPLSREDLLAELQGTEHRLIALERPLQDLAAYGTAARALEHEWLCFLNSYSVILADDWLGHLARAAELPGVGLAGATGSWESQSPLVQGGAWHWLYQLAMLPKARRAFPRFPNPHIRTTAFMLERRVALKLGLERACDKQAAYRLENGRQSITNQIRRKGSRAVVVGRDGQAYESEEWPSSHTYRSGDQENLLVADNRTSEWQQADPKQRERLARQAWVGGVYPRAPQEPPS